MEREVGSDIISSSSHALSVRPARYTKREVLPVFEDGLRLALHSAQRLLLFSFSFVPSCA